MTTAAPLPQAEEDHALALEAREAFDSLFHKLAWAHDDRAHAARLICEWAVDSLEASS